MKVAVVGGGVVGLCVAEALATRGGEVVVLEANTLDAAGSAGSGGWVTPGLSNPLPAPGTINQALRWMVNPRSPFLVHPVLRGDFARWLFDFWRNTSPRRYSAGMAALVALSQRVIADFDSLAERASFEMHGKGLLAVGSERAVASEFEVLSDQQRLGYPGRFKVLDRDEALRREPALADGIGGAIDAMDERHVRPESLACGLVERLRSQGVELRAQTPVRSLIRRRAGWDLECEGENIAAESVVVASGVRSAGLLAPLGVILPLEGAKGYSITVEDPAVELQGPILLLDSKVAVSPFDRALRLAGTLELGTRGQNLNRLRVDAIRSAGENALNGWDGNSQWHMWSGLRPLLPDGLPVIGPVPGLRGLHVATGHAMLGVTLAPTTAALLAPVVLEGMPSLELASFSIARFNNRGSRVTKTL